MSAAIAFPARDRAAPLPLEIGEAAGEGEGGREQAEIGRGIGVGTKEGGRDDILDLRCPGQRVHRNGEGRKGDGRGYETLRDIGATEHLGGKGIGREDDDEHGNAAIGENHADDRDGENCPLGAHDPRDARDDRARRPRYLDKLAEDGAEEEYREIEFHECRELVHEQAAEGRRHCAGVGEKDRGHGDERGDKDDAESAISEIDERRERTETYPKSHCARLPISFAAAILSMFPMHKKQS